MKRNLYEQHLHQSKMRLAAHEVLKNRWCSDIILLNAVSDKNG